MHANSSRSNSLRSIFCAQIRWLLASIPILRMKQIGRLSQILKSVIIREHRATWTPTVFTYFSGLLMAVFLSAKWPLVVNYVITEVTRSYFVTVPNPNWTPLTDMDVCFTERTGNEDWHPSSVIPLTTSAVHTTSHNGLKAHTKQAAWVVPAESSRALSFSLVLASCQIYLRCRGHASSFQAWLSIELMIPTGFLKSEN